MSASGYGSIHSTSPRRVGCGSSVGCVSPSSLARARPERSMFKQPLVAPRYSQVRIDDRPSNELSPRQAAMERILGIVKRAEHAIAMQVQLVTMGIDELAKGRLVSRLGALDQVW